jgi:hypothetical protein
MSGSNETNRYEFYLLFLAVYQNALQNTYSHHNCAGAQPELSIAVMQLFQLGGQQTTLLELSLESYYDVVCQVLIFPQISK